MFERMTRKSRSTKGGFPTVTRESSRPAAIGDTVNYQGRDVLVIDDEHVYDDNSGLCKGHNVILETGVRVPVEDVVVVKTASCGPEDKHASTVIKKTAQSVELPAGWILIDPSTEFTVDDMGLAAKKGKMSIAAYGPTKDAFVYSRDGYVTNYGTRYDNGTWSWDDEQARNQFGPVAQALYLMGHPKTAKTAKMWVQNQQALTGPDTWGVVYADESGKTAPQKAIKWFSKTDEIVFTTFFDVYGNVHTLLNPATSYDYLEQSTGYYVSYPTFPDGELHTELLDKDGDVWVDHDDATFRAVMRTAGVTPVEALPTKDACKECTLANGTTCSLLDGSSFSYAQQFNNAASYLRGDAQFCLSGKPNTKDHNIPSPFEVEMLADRTTATRRRGAGVEDPLDLIVGQEFRVSQLLGNFSAEDLIASGWPSLASDPLEPKDPYGDFAVINSEYSVVAEGEVYVTHLETRPKLVHMIFKTLYGAEFGGMYGSKKAPHRSSHGRSRRAGVPMGEASRYTVTGGYQLGDLELEKGDLVNTPRGLGKYTGYTATDDNGVVRLEIKFDTGVDLFPPEDVTLICAYRKVGGVCVSCGSKMVVDDLGGDLPICPTCGSHSSKRGGTR